MIDTRGYVSVAEAARRLHLSPEQVRRRLREGQLKGERAGHQWFVEEMATRHHATSEPLIPQDLASRIDERREALRKRGLVFDVVELLREDRESH